MQNVESSSLKYEFTLVGGPKNVYSFQTVNGISYEITFKPTFYLFGEDSLFSPFTYEFSIILVNNPLDREPPADLKIPPTIAAIFAEFFKNAPQTVIVYICDSSDGRQLFRKRKFDRWFEYYKGAFIKIDTSFDEADGTNYPVSLILKGNNPFRDQVVTQFFSIIDSFNQTK